MKNKTLCQIYDSSRVVKIIDCLNGDEAELQAEYQLVDGTMKVADAVAIVEDYFNNLEYFKDERIIGKVSRVKVCKYDSDTYFYNFKVLTLIDEVPVVALTSDSYSDGETDQIKVKQTGGIDYADIMMMQVGTIDYLYAGYCNMTFEEGQVTTEILSLQQVFELIKAQFTNSVVYDVESITLGYITYIEGNEENVLPVLTRPVYDIELTTTSYSLSLTIDTVTGEMNYFKD